MSDSGGETPYRLAFEGGVTPLDAAWLEVASLPTADYFSMRDEEPDDSFGDNPEISLQMVGLAENESAALVKHHSKTTDAGLEEIAGRLYKSHVRCGMDEAEARHATNTFILGILVGRQEAQIIERYTQQGINEAQQL